MLSDGHASAVELRGDAHEIMTRICTFHGSVTDYVSLTREPVNQNARRLREKVDFRKNNSEREAELDGRISSLGSSDTDLYTFLSKYSHSDTRWICVRPRPRGTNVPEFGDFRYKTPAFCELFTVDT